MATTNPITNATIQTKPYSSSYSDGWERCFLKKPQEWLDSLYAGTVVKSRDGFRDGTWETPMRKEEFENRLTYCTLYNMPQAWLDQLQDQIDE